MFYICPCTKIHQSLFLVTSLLYLMLSSKITSIFLVIFSITPLEKEWQLLATTDRLTSNTAIFVEKIQLGQLQHALFTVLSLNPRNLQQDPLNRPTKPEYLIAQGSVGKVPCNFWWIETSSNTSSNLNLLFSPNQLLPNWAKLRNIQAFKTKKMFHSLKKLPTNYSNLPTNISPNSPSKPPELETSLKKRSPACATIVQFPSSNRVRWKSPPQMGAKLWIKSRRTRTVFK